MSGDGLQADLDELANLAGRLRTLMVGGSGSPSSGQTWQATAAATNGVQASVDAASAALGNRMADTASGIDGAAGDLAKNEGISSDMVSSIGDVATKPGADFAGDLSGTVGDVTSAFTSAVADVTGELASAVAAPLGGLAGALDFAALADVTNGDNGGLFDGIVGDSDGGEQLAAQESPASDSGGNPESGNPETGQVI
jgi:hypothetical protein